MLKSVWCTRMASRSDIGWSVLMPSGRSSPPTGGCIPWKRRHAREIAAEPSSRLTWTQWTQPHDLQRHVSASASKTGMMDAALAFNDNLPRYPGTRMSKLSRSPETSDAASLSDDGRPNAATYLSCEAMELSMRSNLRSQACVDLRPLLSDSDATEMLLLARGQLNRAFRQHGLSPPDPLPAGEVAGVDVMVSDDPAGLGMAHAKKRFPEAFMFWAATMPLDLVDPVLSILRLSHERMSSQLNAPVTAKLAVKKAYDFLAAYSDLEQERYDA